MNNTIIIRGEIQCQKLNKRLISFNKNYPNKRSVYVGLVVPLQELNKNVIVQPMQLNHTLP
jgi:hypothetical protein